MEVVSSSSTSDHDTDCGGSDKDAKDQDMSIIEPKLFFR